MAFEKPSPNPQTWRPILTRAAAVIRRNTGEVITRKEAEKMARYLVAVLVPRRTPGKKATPEVTAAAALKQQGKKWEVIYPEVLPDYGDMPRHERSWRCFNLRRSVAAYLKRRRLRSPQMTG